MERRWIWAMLSGIVGWALGALAYWLWKGC